MSVIITTHCRPRNLLRAIASARRSSCRDVEVIVVDDQSTDETAAVCRDVPGITYVRVERNQGVAGARNIGILASHGDLLSFLDDDDERLPASLDRQVDALASCPDAAFVYGQAIVAGSDGLHPLRCPQGDIFWELMAANFVPCGTVVFRRSCLYNVGLLDSLVPGVDDWDLWVRMAERHPVLAVKEPVLTYRQSTPLSGQGSSSAAKMAALSTEQLRQCWLKLPRAAASSGAQRRAASRRFSRTMSAHLAVQAWRAAAVGAPLVGVCNAMSALRLSPLGTARYVAHKALEQGIANRAAAEWRAARVNGPARLRRPPVGPGTL